MKIRSLAILLTLMALSMSSCKDENLIHFVVCPEEFSIEMRTKTEVHDKRSVLFDAKYQVIFVEKENNTVNIAKHYKPEHTFTDRMHDRIVSWEEPIHISTAIITNKVTEQSGIAVKKIKDNAWRVYWLKKDDILTISEENVVYLPAYGDLQLK